MSKFQISDIYKSILFSEIIKQHLQSNSQYFHVIFNINVSIIPEWAISH